MSKALRYFVVDFFNGTDRYCHNWCLAMGWTQATGFKDADVIVFPGSGTDTYPPLYNEEIDRRTNWSERSREYDVQSFKLIRDAMSKGKLIFGICRGLQLIHCAMGGKLNQHVDGHGGSHEVALLSPDGSSTPMNLQASHHQQVMLDTMTAAKGEIVAVDGRNKDAVEAVVYPLAKAFGVQFHPEWCDSPKLNAWIGTWLEELRNNDPLKEVV